MGRREEVGFGRLGVGVVFLFFECRFEEVHDIGFEWFFG